MTHIRKKILCVCEGGFTRSVCLAMHLKHTNRGHDALAASWRFNDPETLEILCAWAEMIVIMQPNMILKIPPVHRGKTKCCDVGPDNYGHSLVPELVKKVSDWSRAEGLTD